MSHQSGGSNGAAKVLPRMQLHQGELLKIGGAHDPLSARLVERAGFPAVWLSGFCASAAYLGMPDANLLTMSESTQLAARVATSVGVPVLGVMLSVTTPVKPVATLPKVSCAMTTGWFPKAVPAREVFGETLKIRSVAALVILNGVLVVLVSVLLLAIKV